MDASLWALFASAFVSSTVLPGNSEIVLVAMLKSGGALPVAAVAVATIGNTLGGLTTYGLGRLLPSRLPESAALSRVRRYGAAALLFSWVPFAGDALCVSAGWLKLSLPVCTLAMVIGKLARYVVVAKAATLF